MMAVRTETGRDCPGRHQRAGQRADRQRRLRHDTDCTQRRSVRPGPRGKYPCPRPPPSRLRGRRPGLDRGRQPRYQHHPRQSAVGHSSGCAHRSRGRRRGHRCGRLTALHPITVRCRCRSRPGARSVHPDEPDPRLAVLAGPDLPHRAIDDHGDVMLISLEGLPGSGKSTQAELLVSRLRSDGYRVAYLPDLVTLDTDPAGRALIELFASTGDPFMRHRSALTDTFLAAALRAHLVAAHIQPALDEHDIVIEDRGAHTMYSYSLASILRHHRMDLDAAIDWLRSFSALTGPQA